MKSKNMAKLGIPVHPSPAVKDGVVLLCIKAHPGMILK